MTTDKHPGHRTRSSKPQQSNGSGGQVRKLSKEKRERVKTLEKLRVMVGSGENCSQLEVMQHVIDYICQLRAKLDQEIDEMDGTEETRRGADFIRQLTLQHVANVFKN